MNNAGQEQDGANGWRHHTRTPGHGGQRSIVGTEHGRMRLSENTGTARHGTARDAPIEQSGGSRYGCRRSGRAGGAPERAGSRAGGVSRPSPSAATGVPLTQASEGHNLQRLENAIQHRLPYGTRPPPRNLYRIHQPPSTATRFNPLASHAIHDPLTIPFFTPLTFFSRPSLVPLVYPPSLTRPSPEPHPAKPTHAFLMSHTHHAFHPSCPAFQPALIPYPHPPYLLRVIREDIGASNVRWGGRLRGW